MFVGNVILNLLSLQKDDMFKDTGSIEVELFMKMFSRAVLFDVRLLSGVMILRVEIRHDLESGKLPSFQSKYIINGRFFFRRDFPAQITGQSSLKSFSEERFHLALFFIVVVLLEIPKERYLIIHSGTSESTPDK